MTTTPITQKLVLNALPVRLAESHKGSYGHALLCCGSARFRGAAHLAAAGALRAGAGLVTLASSEAVLNTVLPNLPECICLPCKPAQDGTLAAENAPLLVSGAQKATALLFGCGLGQSGDTALLLGSVQNATHCPLVLDADGLNLLSQMGLLAPFDRPAILTPHPGEMARLCGVPVSEVDQNGAQLAGQFARQNNCVLVLKSHRTLVAAPDGRLWQNTTGNAGLARGGSGDLLAGMITGFLAQGLSAEMAACCGVYLHGAAADRCRERRSMQAMLPHDILDDLCTILVDAGR